MKRVFKKNQIVLTLLAVMIAVAGYLNYISREDTGQAEAAGLTDISEEDILLENQAAGTGAEETEGTSESQAQPGEAVFTSGTNVVEFMSEISLNKEQVRARNKEALLEIVNNENISAEQKQEAIDTMVSMTTIAEKENAAETLLKTKGFENSVVSITDGSVDVVIGRTELSDAERAQVEDIVKRKTDIPVENITISLMTADALSGEESQVSSTSGTAGTEEAAETAAAEETQAETAAESQAETVAQ